MHITFIGAVQILIGAYLYLFSSIQRLFVFVMVSTLFGGSAAANILGGASITPAYFALMFLLLRAATPGNQVIDLVRAATWENIWLAAYAAYGTFTAFVMPRLFAGSMDVTPLRGQLRQHYGSELARILASEPLRFSMQNVTTAVYTLGAVAIAVMSHVVCSLPGGRDRFVRAAGVIGTCHALLGFAGVALKSTPFNIVFSLLRNANYAQLNHEYDGFARMSGVWPEASSFAAYAIIWFAFNFECWLRGSVTRWSGLATLLLGVALVASTSSSAYVGLAMFAGVMALRILLSPALLPPSRMAAIALAVLGVIFIITAVLIISPAWAERFQSMLLHMTVDKADSFSGRQRLFWAGQGITAFHVSYGLGIGLGSFRSSSLVTAILGSVGVIGAATFLMHIWRAFSPARRSTYLPSHDADLDVGAAAAWAVMIACGVASISYPSANPGIELALLSGAAIGLRARKPALPPLSQATAYPPVNTPQIAAI